MAERRTIASFSIVGLLIPHFLISLFVLGLGIGIGYLLRKIFGIDLGIGILTGVIATGVCLHFSTKLIGALHNASFEDDDDDDDEYYVPPRRREKRRRRQ